MENFHKDNRLGLRAGLLLFLYRYNILPNNIVRHILRRKIMISVPMKQYPNCKVMNVDVNDKKIIVSTKPDKDLWTVGLIISQSDTEIVFTNTYKCTLALKRQSTSVVWQLHGYYY